MTILSLVAAIGKNRELGYQNDLVWKISADLKNFKRLTLGHTLLMGRKTFESIGRPLPGRTTLVLSRSSMTFPQGVVSVSSLDEALLWSEQKKIAELMICGGGELYRQTIEKAKHLYLSHIDAESKADTFFPDFKIKDWRIVSEELHAPEHQSPAWRFVHYERLES